MQKFRIDYTGNNNLQQNNSTNISKRPKPIKTKTIPKVIQNTFCFGKYRN